jgi:putative addiction module antidote
MTIKTKVRKIGNSYGIVLPKEALHRLKVKEGDVLYLTDSPGCAMRVTPGDALAARKAEIVEDLMSRYRNALQELAK